MIFYTQSSVFTFQSHTCVLLPPQTKAKGPFNKHMTLQIFVERFGNLFGPFSLFAFVAFLAFLAFLGLHKSRRPGSQSTNKLNLVLIS